MFEGDFLDVRDGCGGREGGGGVPFKEGYGTVVSAAEGADALPVGAKLRCPWACGTPVEVWHFTFVLASFGACYTEGGGL